MSEARKVPSTRGQAFAEALRAPLAGCLGTGGKATKTLLEERQKERAV